MILTIIICILLTLVVGLLGVIGYMLYRFLHAGIPMQDERGRYMTDVDINALVAARERVVRESGELNKEYKSQDVPVMGESTLNQSGRIIRTNRKHNDLIPFGMSDTEADILEEYYRQ